MWETLFLVFLSPLLLVVCAKSLKLSGCLVSHKRSELGSTGSSKRKADRP